MSPSPQLIARYVGWIDRHRRLVLAAGVLVGLVGTLLSLQLPLRTQFADLLPRSRQSVRDLEALQGRVRAFGTLLVVIEADDPSVRTAAARDLHQRLVKVDPRLLAHVAYDDAAARRYFWDNRFLFADLADLEEARQALHDKIRRARLAANPLYVDFEDEPIDDRALSERITSLRRRLDDAEARLTGASDGFVSPDGRLQLLVARSTAPNSDLAANGKLMAEVGAAVAQTRKAYPGVVVGVTGDVVTTVYEHQSIIRGMTLAGVLTIVLCAIALLLFYRSGLPVLASLLALAIGTTATYGFTWAVIGELNVMTAFLVAIVVGNGINTGLIVLARYFEEVRSGRPGNDGLAATLAGTLRGTLVAAAAASMAYGSLAVTEFRGYRHFGVIGAAGMLLCWVATFTVLPAALCELRARGRIRVKSEPAIGSLLARLVPRDPRLTVVVGLIAIVVVGFLAVRFITGDPLENDWRKLRPLSADIRQARAWGMRIAENFDESIHAGLSQRFVIAVSDRSQVGAVMEVLRAAPRDLIRSQVSFDSLRPSDQERKLAILADIRAQLDDEIIDTLEADERELVDRIRPPVGLRPLVDGDVPDELTWPFIEKDGSQGRLVFVSGSPHFEAWNVSHRVEFARQVRELPLPEGALVGGESFVIADIIESVERDGPLASVVSMAGALLVVVLVFGRGRHTAVVLFSGLVGIVGMIGVCGLVGLKVHFLDYIALPITIGIGIDYAVNLAARDRDDGGRGPRHVLSTTGMAVILCSYTTMVGYASLLLSETGGIRAFGLAAIIGEVTCLVAALYLTPSLLALWRGRTS